MAWIRQADSVKILRRGADQRPSWWPSNASIVTSLPDMSELEETLKKDDPSSPWNTFVGVEERYRAWLDEVLHLLIRDVRPEEYLILFQTDRKTKGTILSKATAIHRAAMLHSCPVRWHKIVLTKDVGQTDLYRPGYSHLICLSRKGKAGQATPDVIDRSEKEYSCGIPNRAAIFVAKFLQDNGRKAIFDPFCGQGLVLMRALKHGLDAFGVDIDEEQAKIAHSNLTRAQKTSGFIDF